MIFISHRMPEIFEICDRVTVMRDGKSIQTLNVKDTNREELVPMGMITQCEAAIRGLDCEYAEGEVVTFPHDLVDLTNYEETAAKYNVEI